MCLSLNVKYLRRRVVIPWTWIKRLLKDHRLTAMTHFETYQYDSYSKDKHIFYEICEKWREESKDSWNLFQKKDFMRTLEATFLLFPCNLEVTWHHYAYKKCCARSGDLIGGHGMTTRQCKRFMLNDNQIFLKFVKREGGEDCIFLICPKLSQMLKETFFQKTLKL